MRLVVCDENWFEPSTWTYPYAGSSWNWVSPGTLATSWTMPGTLIMLWASGVGISPLWLQVLASPANHPPFQITNEPTSSCWWLWSMIGAPDTVTLVAFASQPERRLTHPLFVAWYESGSWDSSVAGMSSPKRKSR